MASSQHHSWTRLENEDILCCYYQSRTPDTRGYRVRMFALWRNLYQDTPFNEQRVADQTLSLLRRKVFTDLELEALRRGCLNVNGHTNTTTAEEVESVIISPIQTDFVHHSVEETSNSPTVDLSTHELIMKDKIEGAYQTDSSRTRLPRLIWNKRLQNLLKEANRVVSYIETSNLTEISSLLYATAVVITETLGFGIRQPKTASVSNNHLPPWEYRLTRKIQHLRADLSRLVAMGAGNLHQENYTSKFECSIQYSTKAYH